MHIIRGHHVLALQRSLEGWQAAPLLERCREHTGCRGSWEKLLNQALLRALDGSRRSPEGVSLLSFIVGIMGSRLAGRAQQRRRLAERALTARETSVTAAPDARLQARQCPATIAQFFAGNPDVLALIAGSARRYLGEAGHPAP